MASLIADGIADVLRERWRSEPPRVHWMKFSIDERDAEEIGRFIRKCKTGHRRSVRDSDCAPMLCSTSVYRHVRYSKGTDSLAKQLLSRMESSVRGRERPEERRRRATAPRY
eukprot:7370760-Pyramimonas_sp.AAC.1